MNQVVTVYKPLGLTPLQFLDQLRIDKPEFKHEKLSYAGRLDPMAEGLMLVLVGEANQEREKYLSLDKIYEFEFILGLSTDSYDLLGIVDQISSNLNISDEELNNVLNQFIGTQTLPYPPFSSKTVAGKPLWWWARENKLEEIEQPLNEFRVFEFDLLQTSFITSNKLLLDIEAKIGLVQGDFRQAEIVKRWNEVLPDNQSLFPIIKCQITCSSGTYVRSIVHQIGQQLRTGAVTLSIHRIKVGEYTL